MIGFLLLLQVGAAAAAPSPEQPEVVVTAVALSQSKRALDECLATKCPPREDIARSLAYARAQFEVGDYEGSRRTLKSARDRNGRYAGSLPVEVSDLHRAGAKVLGLSGLLDAERAALFDMIDALREGLPDDKARILLAKLAIADAHARDGRFDAALARYQAIRREARRASMGLVEGMVMFHKAVLLSVAAGKVPAFGEGARIARRDIMDTTDPAMAPFRNGVRLLPVANYGDQERRREALAAGLAQMEPVTLNKPLLVYEPRLKLEPDQFGAAPGVDTLWVDIGYTVLPNGQTADVHAIGRSEEFDQRWADAVSAVVAGRRYMPRMLQPNSAGTRRIERFSFISDLKLDTGTHVTTRTATRRIVSTDLSPDAKF